MQSFRLLFIVLCATGCAAFVSSSAYAQECQNQLVIDACRISCEATGDVCGGVCGAGRSVCRDGCNVTYDACALGCDSCDLACDACCALPDAVCDCSDCEDGCNDCDAACNSTRDGCRTACDFDCESCTLDCGSGCPSCVPFKLPGESCTPIVDVCASGLQCWPGSFSGEDGFRCVPEVSNELIQDEACRALHSKGLHDDVIESGITSSYGAGAAAAAVGGASIEIGAVYGDDGYFGCYRTICFGAETNAEVNAYAATGQFESYDVFAGDSIAEIGAAGVSVVSVVVALVLNTSGQIIGGFEAISGGVSIAPIQLGVYACNTVVDSVGFYEDGELKEIANSAPIARCKDVSVCGESVQAVSIDNGSSDPDNDPLSLLQLPEGPYEAGSTTVTLTVVDGRGESDSCTATVTVDEQCPSGRLCGAGFGFLPQAPMLGMTFFILCGVRIVRRRD